MKCSFIQCNNFHCSSSWKPQIKEWKTCSCLVSPKFGFDQEETSKLVKSLVSAKSKTCSYLASHWLRGSQSFTFSQRKTRQWFTFLIAMEDWFCLNLTGNGVDIKTITIRSPLISYSRLHP